MRQYEKTVRNKKKPENTLAAAPRFDAKERELFLQTMFLRDAIIWNTEYVGKKRRNGSLLSEEFKKIQLTNDAIVIQMFREYPIDVNKIDFSPNGKIASWIWDPTMIDNRQHSTHEEHWVLNPIAVISKAVIVAMSPEVVLSYIKRREELKAAGVDVSGYVIPEVGDVVYTNHFMTKNMRYYIDKQEQVRDIVTSPKEFRLDGFDFLFKVTQYEIQSIVKKQYADDLVDNKFPLEDAILAISKNTMSDLFDGITNGNEAG